METLDLLDSMLRSFHRGRLTRQDFIKRGLAAGLTLPVLSSMLGPEAASAASASSGPRVTRGGTLTMDENGAPNDLDPLVTNLVVMRPIMENIWDSLIHYNPNLTLAPRLAQTFTMRNITTLELQLVRNATFHNGAPFTAEDVAYTVDRVISPSFQSVSKPLWAPIERVDIVDKYRVRIVTKAPDAALPYRLPRLYMLSKSAEKQIKSHPIGTGPFMFDQWAPTSQLSVKRNPHYWIPNRPYLDGIIYRSVTDEPTRLANLSAGQSDVMWDTTLQNAKVIRSNPKLTLAQTKANNVYNAFELNDKRLTDRRVRLALAYAFDRETYVKTFLFGFGVADIAPFAPGTFAYDAALANSIPFDLKKAKSLLAEAGYGPHKPLKLYLMLPAGYPDLLNAATQLNAALTTIGAQADIHVLELGVWVDKLVNKHDFDVSVDVFQGGAEDPATALTGSPFFAPGGPILQYNSPQWTQLLATADTILDPAKRRAAYIQAQQLWLHDMPGILFSFKSILHGVGSRVHGFTADPRYTQDFRSVWLSTS